MGGKGPMVPAGGGTDGIITALQDIPSTAAMTGKQDGTHRLSPTCGTIPPGMFSVSREGVREKGEKRHVPCTALTQPFPRTCTAGRAGRADPSLADGCAGADGFPCPRTTLPRSLAAERPTPTSPHHWFIPKGLRVGAGGAPNPARARRCRPAGLPEGCAGSAVPSYRSPRLEGCGWDATGEAGPCLGVSRYPHGRN